MSCNYYAATFFGVFVDIVISPVSGGPTFCPKPRIHFPETKFYIHQCSYVAPAVRTYIRQKWNVKLFCANIYAK